MATGKAIDLIARPVQSVDLCFPVDGVVQHLASSLLGERVQAFDIDELFKDLGTTTRDDARLYFDSFHIYQTLAPQVLATLRAEPNKAALDKSIKMRENAYVTTYDIDVVNMAAELFFENSADNGLTLPNLIDGLLETVKNKHLSIKGAYDADGVNIVKNVTSNMTGESVVQPLPAPTIQPPFVNDSSSTTIQQSIGYRHPSYDNDIAYFEAQIRNVRDKFNAYRMQKMCRYHEQTFSNELSALDQDIRQLQAAYIDTILVSPFVGVVTGVFRHPGDFVRAGQPVMRIENDSQAYLVGKIKYRGMIRVNAHVTISTTLFDEEDLTIDGVVKSVRGHDAANEQWDVLILCANLTNNGDAIFPLNYNLDYDVTTLEF